MNETQKFEVKRKAFEFTIDGETHKVSPPTIGQVKSLNKKMKAKTKDDDEIEFSIDFLAELGLPKNVTEGLQPEMLDFIVETVTGQKKS